MNKFESNLITSAIRELWHSPEDDRKFTIKPARVTPTRGVRALMANTLNAYDLPNQTDKFVVYEMGQMDIEALGIQSSLLNWLGLDVLSVINDMYLNIHINSLMIPITACSIIRLSNKNLVLAINTSIASNLLVDNLPLYITFFSNDWFATSNNVSPLPVLEIGGYLNVLSDAIDVLTTFQNNRPGNNLIYHNGYYEDAIYSNDLTIGDTLTISEDSSGIGYDDFFIADLDAFTSSLDNVNKLIVYMPPKPNESNHTAIPSDELEIYICETYTDGIGNNRVRGIYYSKISEASVRMLTHRDFAVNNTRIQALMAEHASTMNWNNPFLRVFRRETTTLMHSANDSLFINDLVRLDVNERKSVISQSASTFQPWEASNLEASPLMHWQDSPMRDLTLESLKGVYSLPEINTRARSSKVINNTTTLPWIMQLGGKLLGFDIDGLLIEIIDIPINSEYKPFALPVDVFTVEYIPGIATEDGVLTNHPVNRNDKADWWSETFYYKLVSTVEWVRAIEGVDFTISPDGDITWDGRHNNSQLTRRTLRDMLYKHKEIEPDLMDEPILLYTGNGDIPYARLDVFINGRRCVPEVDFITNGKELLFFNKEYYLTEPDFVSVDIFWHGTELPLNSESNWNFIKHGVLRLDDPSIFIRNRDMSLSVNGYTKSIDDAGVREIQGSLSPATWEEGSLFGANKWPQVMSAYTRNRLTVSDGEDERGASGTINNIVPPVIDTSPVFIIKPYTLMSPWIRSIILDLRSRNINVDRVWTDADLALLMDDYLGAFDSDVLNIRFEPGTVSIHPTPNLLQVEILEAEFMFLRRLNNYYADTTLLFNSFLTIGNL